MSARRFVMPHWKARYPSTIVDVDSSLVSDPDLRKFIIERDFEKAASRMKEIKRTKVPHLLDGWQETLSVPSLGGSKVLAMSRLPSQAVADILGTDVAEGYSTIPEGKPEDLEDTLKWMDQKWSLSNKSRILLTSRCATATRAAEICIDTFSRIDTVFGRFYSNKGDYGTQEQIEKFNKRLWSILALSMSAQLATRQLAVNENEHPVLRDIPDHGVQYFADYAYPQLKNRGKLSGSLSEKIWTAKDVAKIPGIAHDYIIPHLQAFLPEENVTNLWTGQEFIAVHIPSSEPSQAPTTNHLAWHFAKYLVDRSNGLGTMYHNIIRKNQVKTKNGNSKNHRDDVVQRHLESFGVVGGANMRNDISEKHILIVEDTFTEGTQSEAMECFLRIHANPLSVTKIALMKTAKRDRANDVYSTIDAHENASKKRFLLPCEEQSYTYAKCRHHDTEPGKEQLSPSIAI